MWPFISYQWGFKEVTHEGRGKASLPAGDAWSPTLCLKIPPRHMHVIPAKAGIQRERQTNVHLDPDFRRDDGSGVLCRKCHCESCFTPENTVLGLSFFLPVSGTSRWDNPRQSRNRLSLCPGFPGSAGCLCLVSLPPLPSR